MFPDHSLNSRSFHDEKLDLLLFALVGLSHGILSCSLRLVGRWERWPRWEEAEEDEAEEEEEEAPRDASPEPEAWMRLSAEERVVG